MDPSLVDTLSLISTGLSAALTIAKALGAPGLIIGVLAFFYTIVSGYRVLSRIGKGPIPIPPDGPGDAPDFPQNYKQDGPPEGQPGP